MGGEKFTSFLYCSTCAGSPPRGRGKASPARSSWAAAGITPAWAGKSSPAQKPPPADRDHPRVGGEKYFSAQHPERGRGITPAWAGKRRLPPCRLVIFGDHPRVGGEKSNELFVVPIEQGSPPRGRGKASRPAALPEIPRITPAWAGKSIQSNGPLYPAWDHPRVGGEKYFSAQHPERGRGITPAWAGKRRSQGAAALQSGDHPRVGGEKTILLKNTSPYSGSPPRGRGKEVADEGIGGIIRITPAWAGKRYAPVCPCDFGWDHPRMGGEKSCRISTTNWPIGSPPHGRGKGSKSKNFLTSTRITPAWAGKSVCTIDYARRNGDHPRVGGEKFEERQAMLVWLGSPPRGRGKDCEYPWFQWLPGITPAWAGKSEYNQYNRPVG